MTHMISRCVFPDGTPHEVIEGAAADFAAENCDRIENPWADWNPLRDHKGIQPDREAAERLLDSQGDYNDGYVRFYDCGVDPDQVQCPKADELDRGARERLDALYEYAAEHSVKKRAAKFVSCPECGSKVSREAYRDAVPKSGPKWWNDRRLLLEFCPVCGKGVFHAGLFRTTLTRA